MIWEPWINNVAAAWNTTPTLAALILAVLLTGCAALCIGGASKSGQGAMIAFILGIVAFTAVGWVPVWTGTVLAMVGAALFIQVVKSSYD